MRKSRTDKGKTRAMYSSKRRPINKIKKCISLDKDLWPSIDLKAAERRQSRSEFINQILRTVLGSTKDFLKYELKEKSRQFNFAKLQAANYNSEKEIEKAMDKVIEQ